MNKDQLWKSVLGELELLMSPMYFTMYFGNTKILSIDDTDLIITLGCSNAVLKQKVEKDYLTKIQNIIKRQTSKAYQITIHIVSFVNPDDKNTQHANEAPLFSQQNIVYDNIRPVQGKSSFRQEYQTSLIPEYTFDTFVVGTNNQLAFTVAKAVAESPGKLYNPLLFYSKVGLGKTHLLHAIGNKALDIDSNLNVYYSTGDDFMNELIDGMQTGRRAESAKFRNKYRNVDILLIDDIHVIAGKERTTEEFFHTFNHLYKNKKQIIVTTDRHPSEIPKLEERLSSRFKMGMIADIQKADYETRIAILRKKNATLNYGITNKVIDFIAENIESNIRELEGSFIQVVVQAKALNINANVDLAKSVLSNSVVLKKEKNIKPSQVIAITSGFFKIDPIQVKSKKRQRAIVQTRQVAMYLLKEINQLTFAQIGELFGGRDHTTAMHSIEKIQNELDNKNFRLKRDITEIKDKIFENRISA